MIYFLVPSTCAQCLLKNLVDFSLIAAPWLVVCTKGFLSAVYRFLIEHGSSFGHPHHHWVPADWPIDSTGTVAAGAAESPL